MVQTKSDIFKSMIWLEIISENDWFHFIQFYFIAISKKDSCKDQLDNKVEKNLIEIVLISKIPGYLYS